METMDLETWGEPPKPKTMPDQQTETQEQKYARLYQEQQQTQQTQQQQVVATLPPELTASIAKLNETLAAQAAEIAALRESNKPKPEPVNESEWVEKIRAGDFKGAQQLIIDSAKAAMVPDMNKLRQEAYQEAVTATQINLEIDRHIQKVKLENPDLVQFERYLTPLVNQRIEEARQAGKIKTNADYLRESKAAIDAEATELRNRSLALRGEGKQEASTRNQQVIASTLLTPNQVQSTQNSEDSQGAPPDVSEASYFAARHAATNRGRGL